MMFNEFVELDDERLAALDILMRQKGRVEKVYNKKVKPKTFNLRDLVCKAYCPWIEKI